MYRSTALFGHRRAALAVALSLAALALPARAQAPDAAVIGTGASFPAKVYAQWAEAYGSERGMVVRYEPKGSSAGVKAIQARQVDFGATDVPLPAKELERLGLFQFPTLVGGIVPVVNLPGVANHRLRLTPEVLAAIYAGRITRWNDRAVTALNPGLGLPETRITRVVRADGSGTTEVFVGYLKQAAPEAAAPIVAKGGKAEWPGEGLLGAEGSSKLVAAVKATPGAIGYVSSDYVMRDRLVGVSLRNRRGEWVEAGLDSYRAAIRAGGLFRNGLDAAPLLDVDGPMVWPIVTATYVLVDRSPASTERVGRALNFFYRSFMLGDQAVAGTGFAPLPTEVQARIIGRLSTFRTPDGRLVPVLGDLGERPAVAAR